MSEEQQLDNSDFGIRGIEKSAGYVEMPSAAPAEEKAGDGLLDTPADRHLARQEMPEPEELFYQDKTGEKLPDNLTIERERGADDLSALRRAKQAEYERQLNDETSAAVDALRQAVTEQPHQQQAQPDAQQPIDQPQPEELQYQQEQAAVAQADKAIEEVLRDPWVRQRIETEFNGVKAQAAAEVQQAQAAYTQAVTQNALVGLAVLNSAFPELAGLGPEQINGALRVMQPQRAEQYRQHVRQISTLVEGYQRQAGALQQQQAHEQLRQHAQQAQAFQQFADHHDKIFDERNKNITPEQMKVFANEAAELFAEHGVSRQDIDQLWKTNPLMRSAAAQQLMLDAARWRQAQKAIAKAAVKAVPQVQRPGVSEPSRGDDGDVAAANARFAKNNTGRDGIRAAADLVAARRRARG
jgi:hypothetical protein